MKNITMKLIERIQGLRNWMLVMLAGCAFASCNVLSEEEEDCAVYVRFKYDMNMKFADAFSNSVKSVTLYAFDKSGVLAYQKTEEGAPLQQEGYRMRLDEIHQGEKADYDYITWAGLEDNDAFMVPLLTVGKSTKEDLYCLLQRAEGGIVNKDLEDLYHGQVDNQSISRVSMDDIVVPLVKNTNSIRIVLQHVSGDPLDVNQFNFTITDENGKMNYDNTLLDKDVTITYQAWNKASGNVDMNADGQRGITEINVAIADLTTARLMADQAQNSKVGPILTITTKEGERVLELPLVECALLYKRLRYEDMPNQEFLDREDEYNFTFFLDDNNRWVSSTIIINSWKVVYQNSELGS